MTLKQGARGTRVRSWQTFLSTFPLCKETPDGLFGSGTELATRAVQTSRGLSTDGVAGDITFSAVDFDARGVATLSRRHPGRRDDTVKRWQAHLKTCRCLPGAADGDFGPATVHATKAFQLLEGLAPDGVAGSGTQARAGQRGWSDASTGADVPAVDDGSALSLGICDAAMGVDQGFLRKRHEGSMKIDRFRAAKVGTWLPTSRPAGAQRVAEIQEQLVSLGLYPATNVDGIYGYRTRAAVRLLQMFTRSRPDVQSPGTPDGVVGPRTAALLSSLASSGSAAIWPVQDPPHRPAAYIEVVRNAGTRFAQDEPWLQMMRDRGTTAPATLPLSKWSSDPNDLHLMGIRRPKNAEVDPHNAACTDLFLLLVNGTLWAFFGNTDPSRKMASRTEPARLVRGQHHYRFGWHKLSDVQRSYLAFRPWSTGVLIGRTKSYERVPSKTEASTVINIHWSGRGASNWSAGCQVIAGASCIDPRGQVVSCEDFVATTYSALSDTGSSVKNMGAYHVITDMFSALGGTQSVHSEGTGLYYTLLDEQDIKTLSPNGAALLDWAVDSMRAAL